MLKIFLPIIIIRCPALVMCASKLFNNFYFIKNQSKYLTVFAAKSVKKTRNSSAFINKKNHGPSGALNPKTRLSVSILIIQTHITYNRPSSQPRIFIYVTTPN